MTSSTDPDERISRIRALALGNNAHAAQRIGMTDSRQRQPAVGKAPHTVPEYATVLAAPRQRAMPEPPYLEPKQPKRIAIHGHALVPGVATHHRLQPFALFGDGFVHAEPKLGFHSVQLCLHPLADRLPQHRETSVTPLLHADVRKTRPARSPVKASTLPLRAAPHDSGPMWVATSHSYDFLIHYTSPV
jgi:hypothetical protein